jgi:hypothetical protein
MTFFRQRGAISGLFLAFLLSIAGSAAAQSYKAEILNEAPPQELAASVRDTLASTGIRVTGPGGPICDLWLRKAIPASASPAQELGVTYPQLAQGTLVGVMRLPADVKDYRKQRVKAGVYTLRFAITPENGSHMGVAPQRDFLLASPAADDRDPATLTLDQTLALSKKTTGSSHPSVWSLSSAESSPKSLPSVFHMDDGDMWLVEFQVTLGASGHVNMALVVVGFAPEA